MFGDTIGITYNAVAKTLKKVNQDNYSAEYYLEDIDMRFSMKIAHTIPAKGAAGESHLVRLDVEHYAAGVLTSTVSVWSVYRTDIAVQDSTNSLRAADALVAFLTSANNVKVLARES